MRDFARACYTILMRSVGRRRERPISVAASAELLREGAKFNEEFQKLSPGRWTGVPKGVYRFRTHEEANRHDEACAAARVAQLAKRPRER